MRGSFAAKTWEQKREKREEGSENTPQNKFIVAAVIMIIFIP